ncbi:hypothetical protein BH11PSE11_BH11PSE11_33320 [soil metagenome]
MTMQLPANVIAQRLPISATCYGYVLRHSQLGILGTILVAHAQDGSYTIRPELAWASSRVEVEDQRRAIFEPIARGWIASQFGLEMPSASLSAAMPEQTEKLTR